MNVLLLVLSSRTKRSEVKDLVFIHVDVLETLRYALSDNWVSPSVRGFIRTLYQSVKERFAKGFMSFRHCKVEQKKTDGRRFLHRRKVFESIS